MDKQIKSSSTQSLKLNFDGLGGRSLVMPNAVCNPNFFVDFTTTSIETLGGGSG
jgi:hypothetical protein